MQHSSPHNLYRMHRIDPTESMTLTKSTPLKLVRGFTYPSLWPTGQLGRLARPRWMTTTELCDHGEPYDEQRKNGSNAKMNGATSTTKGTLADQHEKRHGTTNYG